MVFMLNILIKKPNDLNFLFKIDQNNQALVQEGVNFQSTRNVATSIPRREAKSGMEIDTFLYLLKFLGVINRERITTEVQLCLTFRNRNA
ncbi:hypothetical protein BGP_2916 [Beggiatoa sp. PS]|nr:hypothetical protein BGP_2916 [Beggiatoa sp. PS]